MDKKNKKLKIAIFHLGFFFSGGGEKLVLKEALGLKKRGHQVDLFAPVVDKKKCFPDLIKKVKVKPLFWGSWFYFPLRDLIAITGAVFLTPLTWWKYRDYDVFFGANQPGPLICYLLSKILKKPYVIYIAQPTRVLYPRKVDKETGFGKGSFNVLYLLAKELKPVIKYLDKISIVSADRVVVNGKYAGKIIEKTYGVKVVSCPAGTEVGFKRLKVKDRLKEPYLLVTNRHFPQKKFEYAIRALKALEKGYPELKLVITGAFTRYTDNLKQLVEKLRIKEKVEFVGLVGEKRLNRLYSQALVYLYTSPEEDFGMGIIEAMAHSLPVVAFNQGGPTETVVNNKTGYLVKVNDQSDFIAKLKSLLKNPNLIVRMGENGLKRAEKFSYERHNDQLTKMLKQVIINRIRT